MSSVKADAGMPPILLGMTLFVASEVMFFGGLFAAYFLLRGTNSPWPPEGSIEASTLLPALLTVLLVTSSATVHRAVAAARSGRAATASRWLGATIGLGLVFLAGQAYEYSELASDGFTVSTDTFTSAFFTLTGFHGLHVAAGLAMLATVWRRLGRYTSRRSGPIEAAGYYWHFVDAIWLLVFATLYVLR